MIEIAITNLSPNAKWRLEGADYANIEWLSNDIPKPTKEALDAEVIRLQAEAAANAYKAQRAKEYPPIGDQLDALWKGGAEAEAMLAKVQAVKQKYPKGA
jgi:hypothetical protein